MRNGAAIAARLGGRRYGNHWQFCCPCHKDRSPSCSIRDDGLITCFAGCPRSAVLAALDALGFVDDGADPPEKWDREYQKQQISKAQAIWEQAPIDDPKVREYLAFRNITMAQVPEVLRPSIFGRNGILAAVQQINCRITAVHNKGRGEKGKNGGCLLYGAVQLAAPIDDELGLAEGVETALSATILTKVPCWATLGASRLDRVDLPDSLRRVHLFGDNDDPGRAAMERATTRYTHLGFQVRRWWPPEQFNDWNDFLRKRVS
jgi:putative DNA primase/helicase